MIGLRNKLRMLSVPVTALAIVSIGSTAFATNSGSLWYSAGQNLENTRYQSKESKISTKNVSKLVVAWEADTTGDVSATPAVDDDNIYFPDAGGSLWALDRSSGTVVWHKTLTDYGLPSGDYARTTPVIAGDQLIFGDQGGKFYGGASMLSVSKKTGQLVWKTKVESHFASIITQSAIWDEDTNTVYVGVASNEEGFAAFIPDYQCCSFRGSMLALNATTGAILWKTFTAPDGYSGNAVWGSTPVIDKQRNSLFITTGNNYSVPQSVSDCVDIALTPEAKQACIASNDYFDSILSLDLATGAVRWSFRAVPFDAWVVSCIPGFSDNDNCPEPAGPDYDFGQGPMLMTVKGAKGKPYDLLGAGQKSGQYWALDPNTGAVVWVAQSGPGGTAGGLEWGSATDGNLVFTANANYDHKSWNLVQNGSSGSVSTSGGIWSAINAVTGQILWQVADSTPDPLQPGLLAGANGPVTLANGVLYGCSMDASGHMYAFDAATGATLWQFSSITSGSCASGPAVVKGNVFWGSGYGGFFGAPGHKMRAFRLP